MSRGFMGSDVFGARVGVAIPVIDQKGRHSMGQSRTEGVEAGTSAEVLCGLLKTALAARSDKIDGSEWNDFFSALNRLRPLEKENAKWQAEVYHQMALVCPDDVSHLRSIPGAPVAMDKCVRLVVKKSPDQIVSTIVLPYQTRGWTLLEIPINLRPFPVNVIEQESFMAPGKVSQESEIWACPPGEQIPKKTSLTAQEAADLAKSLGGAIGPVRSATPEAQACVKDSQVDLAVTEKLLERLTSAASSKNGDSIDVTQDEVDAANKVIDCASKLGAVIVPTPVSLATGEVSPFATAGIIGNAAEGAFIFGV